jgi:hypothetical protein
MSAHFSHVIEPPTCGGYREVFEGVIVDEIVLFGADESVSEEEPDEEHPASRKRATTDV